MQDHHYKQTTQTASTLWPHYASKMIQENGIQGFSLVSSITTWDSLTWSSENDMVTVLMAGEWEWNEEAIIVERIRREDWWIGER